MTSLYFGPEQLDINAYTGDSFQVSFTILNHNDGVYSTTGSWRMKFYDKDTDSVLDTSPTGIVINPVGNGFKVNQFSYIATAEQNTFSGADQNTNVLSYIVGTTVLYKNNVLVPANQYTASNGATILLNSAAALNDVIKIDCLSINTANGITGVFVSNELTSLLSQTASVIYDFYLDNGVDRYTFAKGDVSFRSIDS